MKYEDSDKLMNKDCESFSDIQMFTEVKAQNKLCKVLDQGMHEVLNLVHKDISGKKGIFPMKHQESFQLKNATRLYPGGRHEF